jgi:hydrogenase maturation protease
MTPFLVIGYGNELRGDDALGPQVARRVTAWSRVEVTGLAVHQLTPELAAVLAEVETVIFVDASADPAQYEVCLRRLEPAPGKWSGHTSDPCWLLALTESLYDRRPVAWLVTMPASEFSFGERLSPSSRAGMDVVLQQINRLLFGTGDELTASIIS